MLVGEPIALLGEEEDLVLILEIDDTTDGDSGPTGPPDPKDSVSFIASNMPTALACIINPAIVLPSLPG